jgi:hypothetical protein
VVTASLKVLYVFIVKVLYVFIVMEHASRRIIHFNVTDHPTAYGPETQMRLLEVTFVTYT